MANKPVCYLARVLIQRDNGPDKPDVTGRYLALIGTTRFISDAAVFASPEQALARMPMKWMCELIPLYAIESHSRIMSKL